MNGYRVIAVVIALVGVALAAYVEYGAPRAAGFVPSFGWFAFEAGPFVLAAVLALLSPFGRTLCAVGLALLALEVYAYYVVFVLPFTDEAPMIYLHKPFYGLAVIAAGMLAGFLLSRARDPVH